MANPSIRADHDMDNTNVFTKPTGLANGDVWDIRYSWFGVDTSLPSCSTFTEIANEVRFHGAGEYIGHAHWYKVITDAASETDKTITRATGTIFWDGGGSAAVQDAATGDQIDDFGSAQGTSTTPSTGAAIDVSVAGGLLFVGSTTYGQNCGTPSGMTQMYELDGGDVEGWHEAIASPVSGATRSATISSVEWIWSFVVYKATAVGGGTTRRYSLSLTGVG